MTTSDIISQLNTYLTQAGYAGIGGATSATTTSGQSNFSDLLDQTTTEDDASGSTNQTLAVAAKGMTPAQQDFYSHPLLGYEEDGYPVVGETEQECCDAIADLTQRAVDRGQDADDLHFILAKYSVHDGFLGPKLGYQMRTAVELTGMTPQHDTDV
jgi:hypothetical protein